MHFFPKKLFFQEKAFDVWDNFKLLHIAAKTIKSAGDTDEKTERRKKQREKYQKRQLILPAGMDIGRFIEDSLQKFVHIFSSCLLINFYFLILTFCLYFQDA